MPPAAPAASGAPPLPANAFAHLQQSPYEAPSSLPASYAPPPDPAPLAPANSGWPNPALAPHNPWAEPVSVAAEPQESSPELQVRSKRGLSRAEAIAYVLIALISGVVILQRTGTLSSWFGTSPTSVYGKFERAVFGPPSINTVRGVEHFLERLKSESEADPSDSTAQ